MINSDDVLGAHSQSSRDRPWAAPKIEDRLTPHNWQPFEHGVPITPLILGLIFREQVHHLVLADLCHVHNVTNVRSWHFSDLSIQADDVRLQSYSGLRFRARLSPLLTRNGHRQCPA